MMSRGSLAIAVGLGCIWLVGCHRSNTSGCEDTKRYADAVSASPVQIPDDLTPPSETDALRLPPVVANSRAPTRPCLEDPPAFSEQIQLGRSADAAKSGPTAGGGREPSRRERREQRRHAGEPK
jgi:hypothetical protein